MYIWYIDVKDNKKDQKHQKDYDHINNFQQLRVMFTRSN